LPRKNVPPKERTKRAAARAATCPTEAEVEESTGWFKSAYEGQPPWDIGRPQPAIIALEEQGEIKGDVLDVGCGTGENSLFLAQRGHTTYGIDIVPGAIETAQEKARQRHEKATFKVLSAFKLDTLGRRFDTVIDCGLFHTFDDDERECFVSGLPAAMRRGGVYHMLCFSDKATQPGPRHVTQEEIRTAFTKGVKAFRVLSIRESYFDTRHRDSRVAAWLASIERM